MVVQLIGRRFRDAQIDLFVSPDPRCPISVILSFLQDGLERRQSPFQAPVDRRALVSVVEDSVPNGIGLGQEGRGPAGIFGRRFMPRIGAG